MPLSLPPKSIIRCDAATAKLVYDQLTSVISGHPGAVKPYTFYEELDNWLGPWGKNGYPIGYGKFYAIAFGTNAKLMADPTAKSWVEKTRVKLQEHLRDYVVGRVKSCTIGGITEPELRQAAFDSHPAAYDEGGLTRVILLAPELIPVIMTIPGREFDPRSADFKPTVKQVFVTIARVAPQVVGNTLAAMAGPAHTGIFRRAVQQDFQRQMDFINLSQELGNIKKTIESGDMDYVPLLEKVIHQLNGREFPDEGFARAAREIIIAAEKRKALVKANLNDLLEQSPPVRGRIDQLK